MSRLPPGVFADANVLYPAVLRDILMDLALAGVIRLHWSAAVETELARALHKTRPDIPPRRIDALIASMNAVLPDARVTPPNDAAQSNHLPDPNDNHVLAAAVHAACDLLLTFNLKHFPAQVLRREGAIDPIHPDAFLLSLLTTNAAPVLAVIEGVRERLTKPSYDQAAYLGHLAGIGLPQTAILLRVLVRA